MVLVGGADRDIISKNLNGRKYARYDSTIGGASPSEDQDIWYVSRFYAQELREAMRGCDRNGIKTSQAFRDFMEYYDSMYVEKADGKNGICVIGVNVNYCTVPKAMKFPREAVAKATRYFLKSAKNSKKFKEGKWDGYINLFFNDNFPTGLLYIVKEVLTKEGYGYSFRYRYERDPAPDYHWYVDDGIVPDPDQIEAIEKAYKAKRSVIKAPTGFGKTALLAKRLTAKFGVRTLFVANKKSLLDDARHEFLSGIVGLLPDDVGEIKDGIFGNFKIVSTTESGDVPHLYQKVIVATIQSLHAKLEDPRTRKKLLEWLKDVKFLMVDETQSINAGQWATVLDNIYSPYRAFLSATP